MDDIRKRDDSRGTRYDNTLTIEGDDDAYFAEDGQVRSRQRGDGRQVMHPDEEEMRRRRAAAQQARRQAGHKPGA